MENNQQTFIEDINLAFQKLTPELAIAIERVWNFDTLERFSENKIESGLRLQPLSTIKAFFYLATLESGKKIFFAGLSADSGLGFIKLKNALQWLHNNEIINVRLGKPKPHCVDPDDVFLDSSPLEWGWKFPKDFHKHEFFPAFWKSLNSGEDEALRRIFAFKTYGRNGTLIERGFRDQPFSTLRVIFYLAATGRGTFTIENLASEAGVSFLQARNAVHWFHRRHLIDVKYKSENEGELNVKPFFEKFEINLSKEDNNVEI